MKAILKIIKRKRFIAKKAINVHPHFDERRSRFLIYIVFASFTVIFLRAGTIIITPPSSDVLSGLAKRQYERKIKLSPYRGPIFDRRGEPLAISIRKPSLFVNPRVFQPSQAEINRLSRLLNINARQLDKLQRRPGYFAWVKRKIDYQVAKEIDEIGIKGLHQVMEPARYYPAGAAASQLIGYVGIDNNGLMGLELEYEHILSGEETHAIRSKDARGRVIFTTASAAAPEESGKRIYLTIDRVIQEIAENALSDGIAAAKAKSGFAIVSDPHTGRLLAIANYPPFDPNSRDIGNLKLTRNKALLDLYEPGSIVKPLVVIDALSKGKTTMHAVHQTHKGYYREGRWRIRDTHAAEEQTTEEVLIHSSNIGTYKIAQLIGPEALFKNYKNFGIGSAENLIGFPQQSVGRIQNWQKWRPVRFANVSFGQGLVVNSLEMVQAFGAIANGGHLMKPLLIDRIENPGRGSQGPETSHMLQRVMSAGVAKQIRHALAKTIDEGSGRNAKMSDYTAAGKTGTSEKVDPITRSYSTDLRLASFIGFTPVNDPHLVIYVVVDEPSVKPYYGGVWAAPIFREIAEKTLRYLNVAPDRLKPSALEPIARGQISKPKSETLQ
ncbi:MAG: peptidoglycan D,D-transpeptidase FtsI family protein [Oligoflexus sp.]